MQISITMGTHVKIHIFRVLSSLKIISKDPHRLYGKPPKTLTEYFSEECVENSKEKKHRSN